MGKKMDMHMRILASGAQALRVFENLKKNIGHVSKAVARIGHISAMSFRGMAAAARFALAPLKIMAGILAGLVGVLTLFGGKTLSASGDMEALRMRLEGVTASAEDAKRIFEETNKIAISSPFEAEELVSARIKLLNIGVTGKKALISLGDAAAITQKPLDDLASMLASMETEPLRAIGIQLKREGQKYEFDFRDRMQKVHKITAKGADNSKKALLSIFDMKYGGGMMKFASSWKGITSTLRSNIKQAMAQFGDGMMPAAKDFVSGINDKLTELMDSGKLQEWGASVAAGLTDMWDRGQAMFQYAKGVIESMNSDTWAEGIKIAMSTGAEIFATSLMNYFSGMGSVFTGLAKLMSGAFLEDMLSLPGMDATNMVGGGTMRGMAKQMFAQQGGSKEEQDDKYAKWINLPDKESRLAQLKPFLGNEREKRFKSGVDTAMGGFDTIGLKNVKDIAGILGRAKTDFATNAGYQGPSFQDLYANTKAEREGPAPVKMQRITFRRPTYSNVDDNPLNRVKMTEEKTITRAGSDVELGQRGKGGAVVVNIENFTVRASDTTKMTNAIVTKSGMPRMAVAGT